MKLTEHQLLILLKVLDGSLSINDRLNIFGYDKETRTRIYDEIINQQLEEVEIKKQS